MSNLPQTTQIKAISIIPPDATGNQRSRLLKFADWLAATGHTWDAPNLAAYRDYLLDRMAPRSTRAHLSTVRARYRAILRDNDTRRALYQVAARYVDRIADRKAYVDEIITELTNAIHPSVSAVVVENVQDEVDSDHIRLTIEEAQNLIDRPGLVPLKRLRDTAIIALMLSTGIREQEVCNLEVQDLRQSADGVLCLHVRRGKGCKTRAIPYGALDGCLAVIDKWLELSGIEQGSVFRGFYKDGRRLRPGAMNPRLIQRMLKAYPITHGGKMVKVCPHDLRRTYARIMYDLGMDMLAISQNLGHADIKTTQGYIGKLGMAKRQPKRAFTFDLSTLDKIEARERTGV